MITPERLAAIRERRSDPVAVGVADRVIAAQDRHLLLDALDETLVALCIAQARLDTIRSLCQPPRSGGWPLLSAQTVLAVLNGQPAPGGAS